MAISTAIIVSHHGTMGGKHSATSQAVTTADRSVTATPTGRLRRLRISASAAIAVKVAMARLTRMPAPTLEA